MKVIILVIMGCDMRAFILPSVELDKWMVNHGLQFTLQLWLLSTNNNYNPD